MNTINNESNPTKNINNIITDYINTIDNLSLVDHSSMTYTFRIAHVSHLDLDGYAATTLTQFMQVFFPRMNIELSLFNITPNKITDTIKILVEDIAQYDLVVITDLAINSELVNIINECDESYKIIMLDHHLTDIKDLPENIIIRKTLSTNSDRLTCATELYFNFLVEGPFKELFSSMPIENFEKIAKFVEYVRIYDTYEFWKFKDLESDDKYMDAPRLNNLFHIMERDEFIEYIRYYIQTPGVDLVQNNDEYPWIEKILEIELRKTSKYVANATKRRILTPFNYSVYKNGEVFNFNYNIAIVTAEKSSPLIANNILDEEKDIDFCAVICNNQVSIYSKKDTVDVSEIARLFGGGGHKEAAGFIIPYHSFASFTLNHFNSIIECAASIS